MEYIIIIIFSILILGILWLVYNINIKEIKKIGNNKRLNNYTNKFPENIEICKTILKQLNNTKVKIEEVKEKNIKTSLYLVMTDTISIANIRDSYTRVQTIAHECIHSIQDKKILWFNFIFSNIYLIYFVAIIIFSLFGIINNYMLYLCILLIASIVQYAVRSFLETDAMTRARYVAKEYIEENNLCTKEELDELIDSYDKLNNLGIKAVNYQILANNMIEVIIYLIVCLI